MQNILVADSGSTKTAWMLVEKDRDRVVRRTPYLTQGLNPFQQEPEAMERILQQELVPALPAVPVTHVFFYGAGCTAEKSPVVASVVRQTVAPEARIRVGSDITANVPPLGYVLGDEGSGAYIGRRLVADCIKGQFSREVCDLFFAETHLTPSAVVQKTYREPMPNRFLASLSPFCARHREMEEIQRFLADCFTQFVLRNVALYDRPDLPVHFVGSIAWYYRDELKRALHTCGFRMGNICQAPLERLAAFYENSHIG